MQKLRVRKVVICRNSKSLASLADGVSSCVEWRTDTRAPAEARQNHETLSTQWRSPLCRSATRLASSLARRPVFLGKYGMSASKPSQVRDFESAPNRRTTATSGGRLIAVKFYVPLLFPILTRSCERPALLMSLERSSACDPD